jgi:hypothetical protein
MGFFMSKKESKEIALSSLISELKKLSSDGKYPSVSRMLARLADSELKDVLSARSELKTEQTGKKSLPKGMMLQINKHIKESLGMSVQENKTDADFQDVVGIIRSACKRKLESRKVDWREADAEQRDRAIKDEIYELIVQLAETYKAGKK